MRSPLHVCHVFATFLPVTSGGVEHYIINVSKYMNSLGYDSSLVTPKYRYRAYPLPKVHNLGFLNVFRIGFFSPPQVKKRYIGPLLNLTLHKFNALLGIELEKWNTNIDLVHIHSGYFSLELGFNLSKQLNRPFIVTIHERLSSQAPILSDKNRKILDSAERIIVHRNYNLAVLRKFNLDHKTIFVPMFIDVREYKKPKNVQFHHASVIRFLFVGRLEERRDPLLLIKAFSKVHSRYTNVELHIIGDGSLKRQVELLVKRYGLEKNVFLHGQQMSIKNYLWNSDIYVSTNTVDDYPSLALREAMSAGLPIINTNAGETRRLIRNGENGILVPPSNSDAFSNAIITLIEDDKLRRELSVNARKSAQEFDIKKGIQPILNIYYELTS